MKYTLDAPGKRVRSALLLWCCELVSGQTNHNAEIAAAAIEMVHTYSLVHDDLPSMDNDDLRRGLATCHKAFDEATAILTGDALLTLAFEILAEEIDDAAIAVKLVGQLASAAGPAGMIAGQMADLKAPLKNTQATEQDLRIIHINKTAKIFQCAAAMGAICGGAKKNRLESLSEYGLKIGMPRQTSALTPRSWESKNHSSWQRNSPTKRQHSWPPSAKKPTPSIGSPSPCSKEQDKNILTNQIQVVLPAKMLAFVRLLIRWFAPTRDLSAIIFF